MAFASCNKSPKACLFVSTATPYVGEPIKITNCSKKYSQSLIEFGDGTPPLTIKGNASHTYYFKKRYILSLTVYNSTSKDVYEAGKKLPINPIVPSSDEINGHWKHYRLSAYDNVFFNENENVFNAELKYDSIISLDYSFIKADDSLIITNSKPNPASNLQVARSWKQLESEKYLIGSDTAQVISYYQDTMIMVMPYKYGYTLGYFSRTR